MHATKLVAIDPGVNHCGVAEFTADGKLKLAYLLDPPGETLDSWADVVEVIDVEHAVIEIPRTYAQKKSAAQRAASDRNDLIHVALVAGMLARVGVYRVFVEPSGWKGQIPKDVCQRRIKQELSPIEKETIDLPSAKSLQHNVWDAIGIGLWRVRRFKGLTSPPALW